ncbi:hypothetical protein Tco_0760524 [Tanacetum coccineum]
MSMTIQSSVKDKILTTPSETSKYEYEIRYHPGKANVVVDALSGKERVKPRHVRAMTMTIQSGMERKGDESLYFMDRIYVLLVGSVMDEAMHQDAAESVRDAIGFEYCLASSSGWTKKRRSPVSLIGPELVLETTDKVVLIKEKLKAGVALEGRSSFWKEGLRLLEELNSVHDTFHVSNLKKCLADASLHVPLDEIKVDKILRFVEEPVEIMDREIKSLKRSKISLVKVHWNPKRDPEFTWKREDYMKSKYS